MGCLPLPLFFILGVVIGNAFWGNTGVLWGAGIGLALGLAFTGAFIALLRGKRK
jgi:hypothetical protein